LESEKGMSAKVVQGTFLRIDLAVSAKFRDLSRAPSETPRIKIVKCE
jgi:hypothetical protein